MGLFSEMFSPRKNPERRLSSAPNQIRPVLQTTADDWGPKPTGYFPDFNAERQGAVGSYNVFEPNNTPGGPVVPAQAITAEKVDQHVFMQVDSTVMPLTHYQGDGRPTGGFDPQTDGPTAPTPRLYSNWYYRARGTTHTSYMDVPDGRKFPATGSQDGASYTYYQNAAVAMEPYNIDPAAYDPAHPERSTDMPDSLYAIPGSPSHGWSEIPVASGAVLDRNQTAHRVQQKSVRQDRLANSTYAGQTYSQSTQHVGRTSATMQSVTPMSSMPGGIA